MRFTLGSVLLMMAILAVAPAAPPQGAQSETPTPVASARAWAENYDFLVEIDGRPATDSRLYSAKGRSAILIMVPGAPRAVVVDTGNRVVLTAAAASVKAGEVEDILLLADEAIGGDPTPLTLERETVVFFLGGKKHRVLRRPPLLGDLSAEAVVAQIPAYRKGMAEYTPTPGDLFYLTGFADPIRMHIFFGSWCPHCRVMVPRFLKCMQAAGNSNLQVTLTGVPSPFADYPAAKEKQVTGVPTIIIYSGDTEIGRIGVFESDSTVEHELVKILYQWKQSRG